MSEAGTEQQLQGLANLLLLQQRLREARNAAELGFILVNDTHSLIPYRSAMLWRTETGAGGRGTITNVAGGAEHDAHSPFMNWMSAVAAELSGRDLQKITHVVREDLSTELQEQWSSHASECLVWCPLHSGGGVYLGSLMLWRDESLTESEQRILMNWLAAARYCLAALRGKPFARPGFEWTLRRKQVLAVVAATVLLLMFVPVHLSVLAQAEIVAREPVVVRSPMDGIVDILAVRPNAEVEQGDLLVQLDDTELQTRLAVAEQTLAISRAQYQQAGQAASFDPNAKASLRVLALETQKRQSEVDYVKSLLERSNVEAEQAGVVMMPNPDELIGKPVVTGERLMTIANPDHTQLEAWLAVGDDIPLLYDARIEFFPNVAPDKKFAAQLRRMDYRAEPTDAGDLAYRIRGEFHDAKELPRIGMRGTAKIYGEQVSLAYYLMRRPLATLRRWLGI